MFKNIKNNKKIFETITVSLVILVVIISIMSPLWSEYPVKSPASDLLNHISGIVEAKNALKEGQFPTRVAPNALDGNRYPVFQFYGNFPYTIGGMLFLFFNIDPYTSLKLVIILSLFIGAFYVYKFGIYTSHNKYASITASVLFLTAPYVLTDIHGRFAFPEVVSIGIIPCIFYYFFRVLSSKKLKYVLILSFFLTLLIHTHNIFSFYTIVFLILMSILFNLFWKKNLFRSARVGTGIAIAILISSWYVVPQLMLMPDLIVKSYLNNPFDRNYLSTLGVLLAPSMILPKPINFFDNPHLGFQIGWPLLTILFLGLYSLFITYQKAKNVNVFKFRTYSILTILIVCLLFSILITWSPINFWRYLPYQFSFVQFPYRFLTYIVIFSALSAPVSLSKTLNGFKLQQAIVIVLISVTIAGFYLPNHIGEPKGTLEKEISSPDMGRGETTAGYRISIDKLRESTYLFGDLKHLVQGFSGEWLLDRAYLFSWDDVPGNDNGRLIEFLTQKFNIDWVKAAKIGKIEDGKTIIVSFEKNHLYLILDDVKTEVNIKIDDGRTAKLSAKLEDDKLNIYDEAILVIKTPASQQELIMKISGNIPEYNAGGILNIGVNGATIRQIKMETGPFEYLIPIPLQNQPSESSTEIKNGEIKKIIKISFSSNKYFIPNEIDPGSTDKRRLVLTINSLKLSDSKNPNFDVIRASEIIKEKISYDTIIVKNDKQSVVELPIFYYPGMMNIKVNRHSVDYFNVGDKVAINLPAGENRVEFRFEGKQWANYLSIVSIVLYSFMILSRLRIRFHIPRRG